MKLIEKYLFIESHPHLTIAQMALEIGVTYSNVWTIATKNGLPFAEVGRKFGRRRKVREVEVVKKGYWDASNPCYV